MKKIEFFLISSIILVVWIDYIPYKIPSIVENSQKFESEIYNLSLAYIASFIFYYINNYLPEKKNSKNIKRVIHNNVMFIIERRKILNNLKNSNVNEKTEIDLNGKYISAEDFLQKLQIDLHQHLDLILTIKERLPTELLRNSLLLKRHPYFKSNFKDWEKFNKYIESYDLLSNKLYSEYKKL